MDLVHAINASLVEAPRRPGGLKDIKSGLAPAVLDYVTALRALYLATGLTVREISATYQLAGSTTSRFLSGERVSGNARLRTVLVEVWALKHNVPDELRVEVETRLAWRHQEALKATSLKAYSRLIANEDLAAAVHEREATQELIKQLQDQLHQQQLLQRNLEEQLRGLPTQRADAQALETRSIRLTDEQQRLLQQVQELNLKLRAAREAQARAEERCAQLEAELDRIDAQSELEITLSGEGLGRQHAEDLAASEERLRQLLNEQERAREETARLQELARQTEEEAERALEHHEHLQRQIRPMQDVLRALDAREPSGRPSWLPPSGPDI